MEDLLLIITTCRHDPLWKKHPPVQNASWDMLAAKDPAVAFITNREGQLLTDIFKDTSQIKDILLTFPPLF